jgi:hypothetical protein
MMLRLDQELHRQREAAITRAQKLVAMEAEVSGLRSLLGDTTASVQKAARGIDLVTAAHRRDTSALEEEMGTAGMAIEATGRSLGQ